MLDSLSLNPGPHTVRVKLTPQLHIHTMSRAHVRTRTHTYTQTIFLKKWVFEPAQWFSGCRYLLCKSDNLSLIFEIHIKLEGKNWVHKVVFWPPNLYHEMHVCTYINYTMFLKFTFIYFTWECVCVYAHNCTHLEVFYVCFGGQTKVISFHSKCFSPTESSCWTPKLLS